MYVRGKEPYCIGNSSKRFFFLNRRTERLPAASRHFTDEFVSLSSLRFGCLGRRLSRELTTTPSTFPPFDVVEALALVPHVAVLNAL
jgi:hypothetical protein